MNAGQTLRAGGMDAVRVRLLVAPVDPEQVEVRSAPRLMMRLWGRGISAMTLPNTIYVDPKVLTRSQGPGPLLVHELIHAVGLDNGEHSPDDVFAAKSVVIPKGQYLQSRKQATEDMVQPPDGSAPMPPIRIGARTVANLKRAWTGGDAN